MRFARILPILATSLLGAQTASAEDYRPEVGHRHPDFTLPTIDDERPLSLSDFRGKKILLVQFASW